MNNKKYIKKEEVDLNSAEQIDDIFIDWATKLIKEREIKSVFTFLEPDKDMNMTKNKALFFSCRGNTDEKSFIVWHNSVVFDYFRDLAEDEFGLVYDKGDE